MEPLLPYPDSEPTDSKPEDVLPISDEIEAIAVAVFALDNSGPAPSEFTQPIIPSAPQQGAEQT